MAGTTETDGRRRRSSGKKGGKNDNKKTEQVVKKGQGKDKGRGTAKHETPASKKNQRRLSGSAVLGLTLLLLLRLFFDFSLFQRIAVFKNKSGKWREVLEQTAETRNPRIETGKIIQEKEIDWSDSIFEPGGYDKPIVIESHKLVFFPVPKNACSIFKKLFRRMMGYNDWLEKMPHAPSDSDGLKHLGNFSRDEQLTMMTSPDWTRAIFVRDPLVRILSAYLDKGLDRRHKGKRMKVHCCLEVPANRTRPDICDKAPFSPYELPIYKSNFPFEDFVDNFLTECPDEHWRPQHKFLKKANWKLINFVGKLEYGMVDTYLMLKQIGAYEEFGASGWGTSHNESIFERNDVRHRTGSINIVDEHYTPKLRKDVYQHVRGDYELKLFNFTIPSDLENL